MQSLVESGRRVLDVSWRYGRSSVFIVDSLLLAGKGATPSVIKGGGGFIFEAMIINVQ